MWTLFIILPIIGYSIFVWIKIYNKLLKYHEAINQAWLLLSNNLDSRKIIIDKIVGFVKIEMKYEMELLDDVEKYKYRMTAKGTTKEEKFNAFLQLDFIVKKIIYNSSLYEVLQTNYHYIGITEEYYHQDYDFFQILNTYNMVVYEYNRLIKTPFYFIITSAHHFNEEKSL